MSVPDNLKIFSLIYEYRAWVLIPLTFLWLMGFVYFLLKLHNLNNKEQSGILFLLFQRLPS